ncbi:MAG TPA: amidohydrolase family protein [Methylomirabilota bacterium]|jgi:predicted TIM-barrel fold metal-dependent hydrolase|nr:amidohydrolase family protein [Methylomirabilota bacterium]
MPLVDAHVHLRTGKLSGTLRPASVELALSLLQEDMEQAGVATSLVVTYPEDIPTLAREASRFPGRLYSLLWFDSRRPERSLHELISLVDRFPTVLIGVKTVFPYLSQSLLQREFFPLYALCQERQLPIQFHCGGSPTMEMLCHPNLFAALARAFPRLTLVCLHSGGGWYQAMPPLLAAYANIFLEVEGIQLHEAQLNLPPRVLPYLLQQADTTKIMFGSDRLVREEKYFRRVQFIQSIPPPHRDHVCYRAAARVYRLPMAADG